MAKHLFMILTEMPAPEDAEAFEAWYVDRHMPDVLAIPGFTAAQRFRLAVDPAAPDATPGFITIYEMETEDRAAVMAEVRRRAGTDLMPIFPGVREGAPKTMFAEAVTQRMLAPD